MSESESLNNIVTYKQIYGYTDQYKRNGDRMSYKCSGTVEQSAP